MFDYIFDTIWIRVAISLVTLGSGVLLWVHVTQLQRAKAALKSSEQHLKLALASANQGFFDLDLQAGMALASPEYLGMLGYGNGRDAWIRIVDWEAKLHPDDLDKARQHLAECAAGKLADYRNEYRLKASDGGWVWIRSTGKVVEWDEAGRGVRMLGMHTDITEQKRREEALENARREADLFRHIVELAPQGVGTADLESGITYQNSAMLKLLGLNSLDEARRHALQDFYRPAEQALLVNTIIPTVLTEGFWIGEVALRALSGKLIPTIHNVYLIRNGEGVPIGFANILTDISERLRQEQSLKESEDRFRSVFELSSDGIVFVDSATGQFFDANPGLSRLLGRSMEEIDGLRIDHIHPPDALPWIREEFGRHIAEGGGVSFDVPILSPDGSLRHADVTSAALSFRGRNLLVGTFRDVTQRWKAEQAIKASERKYRELYESLMDAYVAIDMSGQIVEFNGAFLALTGYRADALKALTYQDITPDHWHEAEQRIIEEQVIKRGFSDVYEKEYRRKDGSIVPIEMRSFLLRDESGQPRGMWAIVRDISERKRQEEHARKLLEIIDTTRDFVGSADGAGNILYLNAGGRRLMGIPEDEDITLTHIADYHPPETARFILEEAIPSSSRDGYWEGESVLLRRNGSTVLVWQSIFFHVSASGEIRQVSTIARDLTERKRIEAALQQSEERLLQAIRVSHIGIFDHDHRTDVVYWSPEQRNIYGFGPDEIVTLAAFINCVHPDDRERIAAAVRSAHDPAGDGLYDVEHRITLRDGETRWVVTRSQTFFEGQGQARHPVRTVGANMDVTERKRIEEAMSRLVAVVEYSHDFVGMSDLQGRPVYHNPAAGRMLGYDGVDGLSIDTVHPPDYVDLIKTVALPTVLKEGSWYGENRIKHRDGRLIPVEQSIFQVKDKNGQIFAYATIMRDVTQRKLAEDALLSLNEELESRVEARTRELAASNRQLIETLGTLRQAQEDLIRSEKLAGLGSLVAGVAHELNTPLGVSLTAITQFQDKTLNLKRSYENDDLSQEDFENYLANATKTAEITLHNVDRAAGLIRSFKQVAVDQASEAVRVINLKKYLQVLIQSLQPELKRGWHRVEIDCPEGIEIETYPGLLAQILSNLVVNSVQHGFGPERSGGLIRIEAARNSDLLRLVYQDDGRGISAEIIDRIFEPFFTTARGQGGSGLGLSIVYNLVVHKLKGKLRCESLPGQGMTMTLEFPVRLEGGGD